ncbi:MAG: SpoIIE family protein phosphatase [candidate division KSB1 bacterium]|nr:SpoIIE family protein phosphatase [candidate division KSB1 bacterium]
MADRLSTNRVSEQLEAIKREVSESRNLAGLYRAVAMGLADLFQARRVLMLHEVECQDGLRPVFAWPEEPLGLWSTLQIPASDPLYCALLEAGEPAILFASLVPRLQEQKSRSLELLSRIAPWDYAIPIGREKYLAAAVFLAGSRRRPDPKGKLAAELEHLADVVSYALMAMLTMERLQREAKEKAKLVEVGKRISASLNVEDVLHGIVEAVREVVPCDHAAVFLLDQDKGELRHAVYQGIAERVPEDFRLKVGQGLVGWVAITGQPVLIRDVRNDSRYLRFFEDSRAELDVPIKRGERVLGVISLESRQPGAFNEHHLELLQAFAGQAAVAIENALLLDELVEKRRLEQELIIAREVQKALLPRSMPRIRGYRFSAITIPSGMVGGDLYDTVEFGDGTVALAIGDVAGKGTPGAILMATLYSTYRGLLRKGFAPRKLMRILNNLLVERLDTESFATLFLSVLSPREKRLRYCNAGHNPPLWIRADGTVRKLSEGGPVLGFVPNLRYADTHITLGPGDIIVMYTDGVTEAANASEELFGEERLMQLAVSYRHLDPRRLRDRIVQAVQEFRGQASLEDDLTLLIVKVQ